MAIIRHYKQDSWKVPLEAPQSPVRKGRVLHLQLGLDVSLCILAPGGAEGEECLKSMLLPMPARAFFLSDLCVTCPGTH